MGHSTGRLRPLRTLRRLAERVDPAPENGDCRFLDALGITPAQKTKVKDVVVDEDGTQHVRYDRTYHRLPVLGGDFVHLSASDVVRHRIVADIVAAYERSDDAGTTGRGDRRSRG